MNFLADASCVKQDRFLTVALIRFESKGDRSTHFPVLYLPPSFPYSNIPYTTATFAFLWQILILSSGKGFSQHYMSHFNWLNFLNPTFLASFLSKLFLLKSWEKNFCKRWVENCIFYYHGTKYLREKHLSGTRNLYVLVCHLIMIFYGGHITRKFFIETYIFIFTAGESSEK